MPKRVLIRPSTWNYKLKNAMFEQGTCYQGLYKNAFALWRKKANECGYTIDTWDVHPIESAHVLWFIDFPRERKELTNVKKRNPKAKYILQILESPTLGPHFFENKNYEHFDVVLSYNRNISNEKRIFSYCLPNTIILNDDFVPFNRRKMSCMINTNRIEGYFAIRQKGTGGLPGLGPLLGGWHVTLRSMFFPAQGELYSWRRKLARCAEAMDTELLHVYGPGWNGEQISWFPWYLNRPYKNCVKGKITENKMIIIKNYRFCISVENYRGNKCYISEKIFDALFAGSVPVYLGEERITDYIPSECFVDVRKYKSIKELLLYIKYCPEHEWQRMYDAGQEFIRSEKIRPFTDEAFAERMMEVLKTVAPIE